jgi:sn-glycerol 3-phosphate transport system substrate-binding protein
VDLAAEGPIEVVFWHPYTALVEEAMHDLANDFNSSQDDVVVTVEAQGTYGELLSKYRESINFDSLPDIAIFDSQAVRDVVDSETILPAQSCIEADSFPLDNIDEAVRANYSIDGALYPASMNVSAPLIYYNRGHFEAAGLDPDDPPSTMAEVREAALTIKEAGVAATPLSFLMQGWFTETWLTGAGVDLVNEDNGRAGHASEATFNGPEALELYTLLQQMNEEGLVAAFSATPGQISQYIAMVSQEASMLIETSSASTTIAAILGGRASLSDLVESGDLGDIAATDIDLAVDLDAAPFPGISEPGEVFIAGGAYYMMNTGSEAEQAAAWEFMKFVNELDQQKTIHLKGSYLPISPEVLNDPEIQLVWETDPAGQWLATAHAQFAAIDPDAPGPSVGPFSEQRIIFNNSLEELLLGGADPATVLNDAEEALTEALQAYADANF